MEKKYGSLLLTLMLMGTLAAAEGNGWGSKHGGEEMHKRMRTELGLTKDQEKKLESHRIDQRAEMEKLMLVVKDKREELKTALENPQMDKGAVQRINEQLKDAQNEMADKRLEGILYVRGVLTPEQFKKFLALRPERGEKGDKRWERGERRGSSPHGSKHTADHPRDEDSMDMPKEHN